MCGPAGARADDSGAFSDVEGDVLYTLDRRLTDLSTETWLLRMPIPSLAACPVAHQVARCGAATPAPLCCRVAARRSDTWRATIRDSCIDS